MNGEIVVPETPNWLNDLEAKRERRVKARLGHEAGAGAPCLKCGDKCPGLDLHFWRKACKACRCPKEEHDVPDDDIYGWAQFQLLGSKPNKIKTKIVLPGKNDEVELEWAPKGQKDTIDKYLKTLPPEALPVKGSQAAQERKQLLQKQIPVHDIDPTLCHELNDEEVSKMEEYIAHIKKSSVGVGQIVNLSSVIKANLHNISPQEAHIIASRYSTGVPFSEIIKLQTGLAQNLENLSLNNPKSTKNQPPLQTMQPSIPGSITEEKMQNSLTPSKFKDITHPWYTNSSPGRGALHPQYSEQFKSRQPSGNQTPNKHGPGSDYALDEKLLQGTNFDPSKTPSQFSGYRTPVYRPGLHGGPPTQDQYPDPHNQERFGYDNSSNQQPPGGALEGDVNATSVPYGHVSVEATHGGIKPNFSQNIHGAGEQYGFETPYFNQTRQDPKLGPNSNTAAQKQLPGYSPSKFDTLSETQDPKAPKSMKDLMYSTYDPSKGPIPEDEFENMFGKNSVDPRIPGYDPNAVFSTYKHDPSVFHSEPLSFPEQNISVPGGGGESYNRPPYNPDGTTKNDQFGNDYRNYEPQNPAAKRELPRYDPVTGKYISEDQRYPESGRDVSSGKQYPLGSDNVQQTGPHGPRKFDPITGKYILEDQRYPEYGMEDSSAKQHPHGLDNVQETGPHGPRKFDPITGKYILEDQRYPEYGMEDSSVKQHPHGLDNVQETGPHGPRKFDPITGKYILEDQRYPEYGMEDSSAKQHPHGLDNVQETGPHGPRKFDPITGKYILEDQRYPEYGMEDSSAKQHPHGLDNVQQTGPHGPRKFNPITGKYILEDQRYPEYGMEDSSAKQHPYGLDSDQQTGPYRPRKFDPITGKYIPIDPESGSDISSRNQYPYMSNNMTQPDPHGMRKFDPITGKYIQEDEKYPDSSGYQNPYGPESTMHGLRKFDPNTGKYIPEDNRYPESGYKDKQYPYASDNPVHSSSQGKGIFDPKTGQYVSEDASSQAGGDRYGPNESPNRNKVADNIRRFNHTDPGSDKNSPYAGHPQFSPSKARKSLESLQPGHINVPEDYLEPHMVNIGSIQDISPEVRAATTQLNPGYDEDSLYGDNGAEYSPESIREILNNIKLPDCHYCKKAFEENEFAVTIDRANVLFHAQCFRCAGCNQSLADNIYFYHKESNNVYCGRDYAKIKGYPRCTACDELIFTKEYCLAENATFHLKHFCCFQCDTPLAGQDYTLEDDKPYCLPCYETSKAAKCSTCELVIKPDEVGCQLNGVHFHAEDRCFRCIVCSLPLMGKKLLLRNEKLYCSHDCFNTGKK